jgi:putative transposase
MKGVRFKEEQIIAIPKQLEKSAPIKDVSRQHGITQQRAYRWRAKFGGMEVTDAQRLRALEADNAKLKRLVAEQALDIIALKDLNSKKW